MPGDIAGIPVLAKFASDVNRRGCGRHFKFSGIANDDDQNDAPSWGDQADREKHRPSQQSGTIGIILGDIAAQMSNVRLLSTSSNRRPFVRRPC
jgi:hypothetical protein